MLDGLDECRDRRGAVVAALHEFLGELSDDVTVLVSTRPSAQADAEQLGLKALVLITPESLAETASAVLAALAPPRLSAEESAAWLSERRAWLARQQSGHHELFDVPLMSMLAAVVAARTAEDAPLPHGRAQLVVAVLDAYITHWETRRQAEGAAIASLDRASAAAAMSESYAVLAHALNQTGTAGLGDAEQLLEHLLLDRYLPMRGQAEQGARQVLWAWRESGILNLSDNGLLRARLRLFVEVGEAAHALARPDELSAWVDTRLTDDDRHSELLLAAELSGDMVTLLVDRLEGTAPTDVVALADLAGLTSRAVAARGAACKDHGGANPAAAVWWERQRAVFLTALQQVNASDDDLWNGATEEQQLRRWAVWRVAELLIDLGAPAHETAQVLATVLPAGLARLAVASAWARTLLGTAVGGSADAAAVEASRAELPDHALAAWLDLIEHGAPVTPADPRRRGLWLAVRARTHQAVFVVAAAAILPDRPDLAANVNQVRTTLGRTHAAQLEALLDRLGHVDVMADERANLARQMSGFASHIAKFDDDVISWLERLAEDCAPGVLTDAQRWHLSEIASLSELHGLAKLGVGEHAIALRRAPQAHRDLDCLAVTLLGLDPVVVSAQARQLLSGHHPRIRWTRLMGTVYRAPAPFTPDWSRSSDPERDRSTLLDVVRSGYRMLTASACRVLAEHPDRQTTGKLLPALLPGLRAEPQHITAMYAGFLGGTKVQEALAIDPAPLVRGAAGRLLTMDALPVDEGLTRLEPLAADPDQTVRALTFGPDARSLPPNVMNTVRDWAAAAGPPAQATCLHCGSVNDAVTSCAKCGLNLLTVATWLSGDDTGTPCPA